MWHTSWEESSMKSNKAVANVASSTKNSIFVEELGRGVHGKKLMEWDL